MTQVEETNSVKTVKRLIATTTRPPYLLLLAFNLLTLLTAAFVLLISAFRYLPYVKLILSALCSPTSLKMPHLVLAVCMPVYYLMKAVADSVSSLIPIGNHKE